MMLFFNALCKIHTSDALKFEVNTEAIQYCVYYKT